MNSSIPPATLPELVLIQLGNDIQRLRQLPAAALNAVVLHHEDENRAVTAIEAIRSVERELQQVRCKLMALSGSEVL